MTATVTVQNDDSAAVTIADVSVAENVAGGTATVTLSLDNAVQGGFRCGRLQPVTGRRRLPAVTIQRSVGSRVDLCRNGWGDRDSDRDAEHRRNR